MQVYKTSFELKDMLEKPLHIHSMQTQNLSPQQIFDLHYADIKSLLHWPACTTIFCYHQKPKIKLRTFFKRKPILLLTLLFNGSCDQTCTFINLFMSFHRIELFLADIPIMLKPCHFGLPPQEQLIFQCTQTIYKKKKKKSPTSVVYILNISLTNFHSSC